VICLGVILVFSNVEPSSLSASPVQIVRLHQPSYKTEYQVKTAPTFNLRLDKIRFVKPSELPLWVYIMDERVIRTPEISKLIKELD